MGARCDARPAQLGAACRRRYGDRRRRWCACRRARAAAVEEEARNGAARAGTGTSGRRRPSGEDPGQMKTDEEWRAELDADRYAILRCAATEPPFSGEYVDE